MWHMEKHVSLSLGTYWNDVRFEHKEKLNSFSTVSPLSPLSYLIHKKKVAMLLNLSLLYYIVVYRQCTDLYPQIDLNEVNNNLELQIIAVHESL